MHSLYRFLSKLAVGRAHSVTENGQLHDWRWSPMNEMFDHSLVNHF